MEDGEVCFLIRISVGIIEAHPMTGQDLKRGRTKTVGQLVSFRLAFARVAAPAVALYHLLPRPAAFTWMETRQTFRRPSSEQTRLTLRQRSESGMSSSSGTSREE